MAINIDDILNVNNDKFRKSVDKEHGYLFDSQIETAKNIVKSLIKHTTRRNHVVLAAKMQSGKTGVCNSVVNIITQTNLDKEMMVNKYFFITGMNDCGLKKQTLNRVKEQVIGASDDNIYIGKRSKKNLSENRFFVMKNSDILKYDGTIDNSVIFIDEAHYGSNESNVLTKFLVKNKINWKDSTDLITRNIYIISVSATPFDEIVSDTKKCKQIVDLKPTSEYVGVTEFIKNGVVFDANKDDIVEDGEIFEIIADNYQRMKNDDKIGAMFIRTRKFDVIKNNKFVADTFDIIELWSNGSNIEYNMVNDKMNELIARNEFNKRIKSLSGKAMVYAKPLSIKPILVLIKGAFRAGITIKDIFKDYIYMIYDYSLKADTTAQALLGRMCGYRSDSSNFAVTHFYINKKYADMYSEWENDFQNREKIPCNKIKWDWLPDDYSGSDAELGTKSCGNFEIPLSLGEIRTIIRDSKKYKSRVEFMKVFLPFLLKKNFINIDYDYVGEAVLSGKNNYNKATQDKRFNAFSKDSLVYQFRPYQMKDFIKDTGRDMLTRDDLGKKAVFCVLDTNINSDGSISGNKRLLVYYVAVGLKKSVTNLRSMYKKHKDTALSA